MRYIALHQASATLLTRELAFAEASIGHGFPGIAAVFLDAPEVHVDRDGSLMLRNPAPSGRRREACLQCAERRHRACTLLDDGEALVAVIGAKMEHPPDDPP